MAKTLHVFPLCVQSIDQGQGRAIVDMPLQGYVVTRLFIHHMFITMSQDNKPKPMTPPNKPFAGDEKKSYGDEKKQ